MAGNTTQTIAVFCILSDRTTRSISVEPFDRLEMHTLSRQIERHVIGDPVRYITEIDSECGVIFEARIGGIMNGETLSQADKRAAAYGYI